MSGYPSADDYAFSLEPRRLAKYLQDTHPLLTALRSGKTIRPTGSHYLHVACGFYAYIFKIKTDQGFFAIRCLRLHLPRDSAARYQAIGQFVATKAPAYMVMCNHFDDALYVSIGTLGRWLPIQVMAWVEGKTLLETVAQRVKSKDKAGLKRLADEWQRLLVQMKQDNVIHGDLHPDNVIVTPKTDEMRLVDYDTMVVPQFTPSTFEGGGMATYIHPCFYRDGQVRQYNPAMDDFGALNILLSLRVLAKNPQFRRTTEYLLFSTEDIEQPDQSTLFEHIIQQNDPETVDLAKAFQNECQSPTETGKLLVSSFVSEKTQTFATIPCPASVPAPSVTVLANIPIEIPSSVSVGRKQVISTDEIVLPPSVQKTGLRTLPAETLLDLPSSSRPK